MRDMGPRREGFDAEWRAVDLLTVDGELINRIEVFDEADLNAAIARFDELGKPATQLENAASQIADRAMAHFTARDWDAAAAMLADDVSTDDRRRTVNAGLRRGRDAAMADAHANGDVGAKEVTSTVIATRGDRLVLRRARYSDGSQRPESFYVDALTIVEINGDGRVAANVVFDIDDIDAAFEELDARYLAGEAAAHARTWSVIARFNAAFNRHEIPGPDWVTIDHRRLVTADTSDLPGLIRDVWDTTPDLSLHNVAVHRLSGLGAVVTRELHGTSKEGFAAEWRMIHILTVAGDRVDRSELFDEADLDAALARFDQLSPQVRRLENTASQLADRVMVHFSAREWDAATAMLAENYSIDDRRRTVNAGFQRGRDTAVKDMHANADLGSKEVTSTVVATRGDRLVLRRARYSASSQRPEAFYVDALSIYEINGVGRIAANVTFDIDDIDAAFEELDARYLAGEAADHAQTWSALTGAFAAINRHELPERTPDWVNIDRRRGAAFATGEMTAYLHELFDDTPDINVYIEVVHRLSNLGAVVTQAAHGTSQQGFQAEWRETGIFKFDGDLLSHYELFDDGDLDAALARFDQLSPQVRRLENAATHVYERFQASYACRDWAALTDMTAENCYSDDRRRVVNGGVIDRAAVIETYRSGAALSLTHATSDTIATRGVRLFLTRDRYWRGDENRKEVVIEVLQIVEIDTEERIAALVTLDPDDFDGALEELESRYIAGEAAAHARAWSAVAGSYASMSRGEFPALTPDCVTMDHRRVAAFAPGELSEYIGAGWDLNHTYRTYVEVVHRLNSLGAVVTHAAHGLAREGFEAEWREVCISMSEGDLISRCELFDEADLDAAIAKFEELTPRASLLENAASQTYERLQACFAARDWAALSAVLADNTLMDDRRRVVGAGVRRGRDATMAGWRSIADIGATDVTSVVIATRGTRLALCRTRAGTSGGFDGEALQIVDIDADERMVALVSFGLDDFDAAVAELERRYLAGEAAAYTRTWSVIAGAYAALNRGEFPATTPDLVNIDHRGEVAFGPGDLITYLRSGLEIDQGISIYIEAVHRLTDFGAAITYAADENSREGFDAEWRGVALLTVEGKTVNRVEVFEEADVDAALARFDELSPHVRRLENAASQAVERFWKYVAARDWAAMAETMVDDFCSRDRRRVVNAGVLSGRAAQVANMQAVAEVGFEGLTSTVVATRGQRLALIRVRSSVRSSAPGEFAAEMLSIVEIDVDNRLTAADLFDADDIDAAIAELDARYLAGEAAAHSHAWSAISQAYAVLNQGEIPTTATNMAEIDHRPLAAIGPGDLKAFLRATFDDSAQNVIYIETVHRLTNLGASSPMWLKGRRERAFTPSGGWSSS